MRLILPHARGWCEPARPAAASFGSDDAAAAGRPARITGDASDTDQHAPPRAGLVLAALILVAGVANLNLSVANVALPDIGKHFDSSQTMLDLIAVGYSLGLAATVLYLGALGDRYGRKLMLLLGLALSVPACLLAAFAPSDMVLFGARVLGGVSAGMAYPTTLALITALWSGPGRTKAIALWSALGGAIASLGPVVAGALLEQFDWGSVFIVTLPLVAGRLPDGRPLRARPRERVDGAGRQPRRRAVDRARRGPHPRHQLRPGAGQDGADAGAGGDRARRARSPSSLRQRRASNPLYDLHVAARRIFWVAACAGIIVFGSLMGAAFISQQFLQNVLVVLDARRRRGVPARDRLHGARRAALGQARRGARRPLHAAVRLRVPAAGLRHDAAAVGGGEPVLEDRARVRVHRDRRRVSPARPRRIR